MIEELLLNEQKFRVLAKQFEGRMASMERQLQFLNSKLEKKETPDRKEEGEQIQNVEEEKGKEEPFREVEHKEKTKNEEEQREEEEKRKRENKKERNRKIIKNLSSDVTKWSVTEVGVWISFLVGDEFGQIFAQNHVLGVELMEMEVIDLEVFFSFSFSLFFFIFNGLFLQVLLDDEEIISLICEALDLLRGGEGAERVIEKAKREAREKGARMKENGFAKYELDRTTSTLLRRESSISSSSLVSLFFFVFFFIFFTPLFSVIIPKIIHFSFFFSF